MGVGTFEVGGVFGSDRPPEEKGMEDGGDGRKDEPTGVYVKGKLASLT